LAPLKSRALWHLHASLFSPATQTWTKAILNNHFSTWLAFTVLEVCKYLPKLVATSMGHMDQQRQNIRSTKRKHKPKQAEDKEGIDDTNPVKATATNTRFANLIKLTNPTQKSYTDLTGRFLLYSSQGNLYVLVLYFYDNNAILVEPLKSRSEGAEIKAYANLLQCIH
jgi:hypothetical protein